MRFRPQAKGQQLGGVLTVWRLVSLTPHCEWRQWSCSSRASGIWPPASLPVSHCNCTKTEENNTDRSEVFRFFVAVIFYLSTYRWCLPSTCGWDLDDDLCLPVFSLCPCRLLVPVWLPDKNLLFWTDAKLLPAGIWTPGRHRRGGKCFIVSSLGKYKVLLY